ncbi:MAG: triacylglycerol lipase [Oscillospiraceae bacterium]|nr:triacylglycerol lipase [Oscillospiraceae bacterium]
MIYLIHILISAINFLLTYLELNLPAIPHSTSAGVRILLGIVLFIYFIVYNIFPTFRRYPEKRLKIMGDGAALIMNFMLTCLFSLPLLIYNIVGTVNGSVSVKTIILYSVTLVLGEAVMFWNGIIRVYLTSSQLAMRYRILGLILGWIPIANIIMLIIIYSKVQTECKVETKKCELDKKRTGLKICATKYPILLVHGVFFRDSSLLNYWGRIPEELKRNGARIYYGEQQSAVSVSESAAELAKRIQSIVLQTGCEKVNIIAHSKGGLDSRYAISRLGSDKNVASLTTINTPHRGCLFADYLIGKAPEKVKKALSATYENAFSRLGDESPDFMAAVTNLTNSFCTEFNKKVPDAPGVLYQSVGTTSAKARSGRFPLNVSYPLVKKFDGDNDGLVALTSMQWGESFITVYPKGSRGITHADMIDLNRENFKGFDVREFYVQLVAKLKERGL